MNQSSKNIKNKGKIQLELLFLILPIAIIPLISVIVFVSLRIYNKLESQSFDYYDTVLAQVNSNLNFVYEQYARTMTNMLETSIVKETLSLPPYKTKEEERNATARMVGNSTSDFGLRKTADEKIDGFTYLYEMNRVSLIDNTNYKMHFCNDPVGRPGDPDYEKLINDPLFKILKDDNQRRLVFGKFQKGVLPGLDGEKKTVFIYSYYKEPPAKKEDTFNAFLLVTLHQGFIENFYKNIEQLRFGTLYILDINNNIISFNHPATSTMEYYDDTDYYEYDPDLDKYLLNKDNPNPEGELLKFNDYKMLNTDVKILEREDIKNIITNNEQDEINKKIFVTHKNKKFLLVKNISDITGVRLVYFHPVKQIQKPIFEIINIMIIVTIFLIIFILIISFIFSKSFTNPIQKLAEATTWVAQGNYNKFIEVKSKNEIGDLANNFNLMIKNIKAYQDKLLTAEREKQEMELASRIQTCLLPNIPEKSHYEITARMIPAAEVGGDYYDIIGETNERLWLGIGDVSGHGLTSGLIMMMAQTAFNTVILNKPDISSAELIVEVNRVMFQNIRQRLGEDHFMTLSFMVADPDGTVTLAGAHLDVLVYRKATKKVERIETTGIWLGLVPDIRENTYEKKFKLEKGDLFFLYTDGLIEATNKNNELYDMQRLINKLEELGEKPVKEIEEMIIKDVFEFMSEQKDDITFIIARKK
ncbi:MAG TPA: PP2C family protein-serine/threonine phosphatase [Spirochaetota bacterium]|nr:PP2C family protein-serine/threonine phosphatase [Spirochaetota bacterium]HOL57805.1 PP2C family protein-serine/threonine phosphatase [Spirochaetota bacterium]HPP05422.1 PP2C family protein-serine/threonine phosphatase [Spirochaetota bacterium]